MIRYLIYYLDQLAKMVDAICALLTSTWDELFLYMLSWLLVSEILGLKVFSRHWSLLCLWVGQAPTTRELTLVPSQKQPSIDNWWNLENKGPSFYVPWKGQKLRHVFCSGSQTKLMYSIQFAHNGNSLENILAFFFNSLCHSLGGVSYNHLPNKSLPMNFYFRVFF